MFIENKKWLTIGDGTGKEAHYIENHGREVLATDIATNFLSISKRKKYIKNYKQVNAEKINLPENSYDFVLCKESYHHFPRPIIALYEMIKVAKEGVVLIEPNDVLKRGFSWDRFISIENLRNYVNRFEVSGNYVYQINRRDIEKIAYGMGLPAIAFSGLDDYYIKGVEKELVKDNTFNYRKIKIILKILDISYKLKIRDRSILVAIIFKKSPTKKIQESLKKNGYKLFFLKKNPYLK